MTRLPLALLAGFTLFTASAQAGALWVPAIFSDNMVLQCETNVLVWGKANPGEEITVSIGEYRTTATADAAGAWMAILSPMKPSDKPRDLVIKALAGGQRLCKNVLIGDIWIGSGQSNMNMPLSNTDGASNFVAAANSPLLRLLKMPLANPAAPTTNSTGKWTVCTPANAGVFSAVLYHFGLNLSTNLNRPVGLIHSAVGGSRIESWSPTNPIPAGTVNPLFEKAKRRALQSFAAWVEQQKVLADAGQPIANSPPSWPTSVSSVAPELYNVMIHPLIPFTVRGFLWYQGESNLLAYDTLFYAQRMKAMIESWRAAWGQGPLPFYYVLIAPFNYGNNSLPLFWEAQMRVADAVPNSAPVSIIDIGTAANIHPPNKQDVGWRLAQLALAKTYGQNLPFAGPRFKSFQVKDKAVRILFKNVGKGLASKDGNSLAWFSVAGEDRMFANATATIDGDAVVVSSPAVPKPVAVRFAWNNCAAPNFVNKDGFAAFPFRTDD